MQKQKQKEKCKSTKHTKTERKNKRKKYTKTLKQKHTQEQKNTKEKDKKTHQKTRFKTELFYVDLLTTVSLLCLESCGYHTNHIINHLLTTILCCHEDRNVKDIIPSNSDGFCHNILHTVDWISLAHYIIKKELRQILLMHLLVRLKIGIYNL